MLHWTNSSTVIASRGRAARRSVVIRSFMGSSMYVDRGPSTVGDSDNVAEPLRVPHGPSRSPNLGSRPAIGSAAGPVESPALNRPLWAFSRQQRRTEDWFRMRVGPGKRTLISLVVTGTLAASALGATGIAGAADAPDPTATPAPTPPASPQIADDRLVVTVAPGTSADAGQAIADHAGARLETRA